MNFRFIAVEEQQLSIRRLKREQSETLRPTARQEAHHGQEHGGEEEVAIPAAIARGIRRREAPRSQATQESRIRRGMPGQSGGGHADLMFTQTRVRTLRSFLGWKCAAFVCTFLLLTHGGILV